MTDNLVDFSFTYSKSNSSSNNDKRETKLQKLISNDSIINRASISNTGIK